MLAFAVALTTGTGILVGLAPALHVSKRDLNAVMKQDAAVAGSGPRGGRLRAVLVGVQVALCMALVIAAGLLLRGLHATYSVDPGFEPGDVTYVSFEPVLGAYDGEEISDLRHAIRTGVEALPGVEAVAWTDREPLGDDSAGIAIRRPGEPEHLLRPAQLHAVGPDYFTLLRLPIVRGRSFTESEADNATSDVRPAVVSETTAGNLWADEDPLGQELLWRAGPEREVTLHIIGGHADAQLTAIGHIMRSTEEGIVTTPLCAGGTVVGLFPDAQYEEGTFDLRPGDRLFAFTDGVTEARNAAGEEFGGERLKALLQNRVGASAEEISTDVADVIHQWTDGAEHQDDVTFVVLAVNTPAIRSAPAGHSIQPTQGTVLLSRHSAPRSVEPSADARSVSSASQATQSRSSRSGLRSSQGRSRRSM